MVVNSSQYKSYNVYFMVLKLRILMTIVMR